MVKYLEKRKWYNMENNVVLVRLFKTSKNKKIIAIFKKYNDLKKWMEEHQEKLIGYSYEIWRKETIKNKFKI